MEGGLIYRGLRGKNVEESSGDGRPSPQGPDGEPVGPLTGNFNPLQTKRRLLHL